jgi:hypothetical protein
MRKVRRHPHDLPGVEVPQAICRDENHTAADHADHFVAGMPVELSYQIPGQGVTRVRTEYQLRGRFLAGLRRDVHDAAS